MVLFLCQKPELGGEGESLPVVKQLNVMLDRHILLTAQLIFDKWPSHSPYDSVGLSEWCWDVWDVLPT